MAMAKIKAACDNCGFVSFYEIPYRAKFNGWLDDSDETTRPASYYAVADRRSVVLCSNCGLPALTGIYWDKKSENPLTSITRVNDLRD